MEPKSPGGDKEGSTSIELGLGIGAAHGGGGGVIKEGKAAFTAAQLHELQQQSLVLNYIVEGLPVPHHLIVPIWKSVAKSFGPANGGIYNQYPTFIGFSHQGFDYKGTTDPEPGRCRRTDGKKWRCSKDVVPHQKYCERHMHRGRNRPKKHTEASVSTPEPNLALSSNSAESSRSTNTKSKEPLPVTIKLELATPSSNNSSYTQVAPATTITSGSYQIQNDVSKKDSTPTTASSIHGGCGIQKQKDTASTVVTTTGTGAARGSDKNLTVKNAAAASIAATSTGGSKNQTNVVVKKETTATSSVHHIGGDVFGNRKDGVAGESSAEAATYTVDMNRSGSDTVMKETAAIITKKESGGETDMIITSTATSSKSAAAVVSCNRRAKNDFDDIKYAEYDHSSTRVNTWSNNDANWRFVSLAPPGFGLSPNSVLQVVGGGNPNPNPDVDVGDTELTRCRRTDGKKWRCSKEVIPDEKYCGRHMHRGAKKLAVGVASLQSVTVATPPPPSSSGVYLDPPLAIPKKATNQLNTELSISIASSSQQGAEEDEDSPSSSDATTITDENGSIAHLLVLSP